MKIAVGSDHGGYELKTVLIRKLERQGHLVVDAGCNSTVSVDYPDFAGRVCSLVIDGEVERGILICGTGIGMSVAANRFVEIRAALCHDEYTARMSRAHNDANVLCLGARVLGVGVADAVVDVWLDTGFEGDRHLQRIAKIS
ncbi:MAG: ribose 5-phosphate isomerase B [Proteobacteria bacterium]|nr:MAG: ribose 5-phosphate isomerase B [Pseudomonadota bacterium]